MNNVSLKGATFSYTVNTTHAWEVGLDILFFFGNITDFCLVLYMYIKAYWEEHVAVCTNIYISLYTLAK